VERASPVWRLRRTARDGVVWYAMWLLSKGALRGADEVVAAGQSARHTLQLDAGCRDAVTLWGLPLPLLTTQTFLNAMTYPDRTVYPVASPNLTDFYNLVDVYLDAVFHPRLNRQVFQQEGWHHELVPAADAAAAAAPTTATATTATTTGVKYKGVVFNEMKGVYMSPDSLHDMAAYTALFPDNAYFHSSGGDPASIPQLTYGAFEGFHRRFYHPSNALLYFYGDDNEARRLHIAAEYLDGFQRRDVDGFVRPQVRVDCSPRMCVSLCLCVSVSLCLCESVSLCLCVSVSLCLCLLTTYRYMSYVVGGVLRPSAYLHYACAAATTDIADIRASSIPGGGCSRCFERRRR
jgi:hypothetical protein